MTRNGSESHSGWRGRWRQMALSALVALTVATSGPVASPASAAGLKGVQAETIRGGATECSAFDDPCVYLVAMTPTQIMIGFEIGTLAAIEHLYGAPRSEEYHVRWSVGGGPEQPETVGPRYNVLSQTFTVTRQADDIRTYRFAVQRCEKVGIGKDDCSGWTVRTYGGTASGIELTPNPNAAGNLIETKPNPRAKPDNGIETSPNPNAAGNLIETKPNPRTKKDNGIDTKPNPNARK